MKYLKIFEEHSRETIAGLDKKPNVSPNPIQRGDTEDEKLSRIRQFKGSVKDFKQYWDERINIGNS